MAFDQALAARVRTLLFKQRHPVVERPMMGGLAFVVNGSMCCSVGPRGLLVRVAPADRALVLELPHVTPMKLGKRTMQGFVRVDSRGLRTEAALDTWLERGLWAAKLKV